MPALPHDSVRSTSLRVSSSHTAALSLVRLVSFSKKKKKEDPGKMMRAEKVA